MSTITKIEKKEDHPTITIPFRLYVKAYAKAIRANPKAKMMTITITVPCSNRVNAFRSEPHNVTTYERRRYGADAWMSGWGTISIPLTAAGRAAKRREHNAPKRESAEWGKRQVQSVRARLGVSE
jgi:hypothetical protein